MIGSLPGVFYLLLQVTSFAAIYSAPRDVTYGKQIAGNSEANRLPSEKNRTPDETKKMPESNSTNKFYYGGHFKDKCLGDGLYFRDETSFVICSRGHPRDHPCPPGTKSSVLRSHKPGYYYDYSQLCSVRLLDNSIDSQRTATNSYSQNGGKFRESISQTKQKIVRVDDTFITKQLLKEFKPKDFNNRINDYKKDEFADNGHLDKPEIGYPKLNDIYPKSQDNQSIPKVGDIKREVTSSKPESDHARPELSFHKPKTDYTKPESGYPRSETSYPKPDDNHQKPVIGYGNSEATYSESETGFPVSESEGSYHRSEASDYKQKSSHIRPGVGYTRPQIGYPDLEVSRLKSEISYPKSGHNYSKQDDSYVKPEVSYPKPGVSYPKPEVSYPKPEDDYASPKAIYPKSEGNNIKSDAIYPDLEANYPKSRDNHLKPEVDYSKPEVENFKSKTAYSKAEVTSSKQDDALSKAGADYLQPDVDYFKPEIDYSKEKSAFDKPETAQTESWVPYTKGGDLHYPRAQEAPSSAPLDHPSSDISKDKSNPTKEEESYASPPPKDEFPVRKLFPTLLSYPPINPHGYPHSGINRYDV